MVDGKIAKPNTWLVWGTWMLVIISGISVWITKSKMEDQVGEIRKSTERQWRPSAVLYSDSYEFDSWYLAGETEDIKSMIRLPLSEVKLGSSKWFGVKYFSFVTPRKLWLKNLGESPLRITNRVFSAISQEEWKVYYEKSAERLLERIMPELSPPEIETIVLPGDSLFFDEKAIMRQVLKVVFESHVADGSIVVYPYSYIEYENVFDATHKKYNVILLRTGGLPLWGRFQVTQVVIKVRDQVHVCSTTRNPPQSGRATGPRGSLL